MSFSSDGKFLASRSGDNLIKIWNLAKKPERITIPIDSEIIEIIEFSSDNKSIIVKFACGNINSYSVDSGNIIDSQNYIPSSKSKTYKCLDPLSLGNGLQNYDLWLSTFMSLSLGQYKMIKNCSITFTNLKYSVLHFIAMIGDKNFVEKFIKSKELMILYDIFGHSPIYYSIQSKHQDLTDMLLEHIGFLSEEEPCSFKFFSLFKEMGNDLPSIIKNSSSKLDYFLSEIIFKNREPFFRKPQKKLPIVELSDLNFIAFQKFLLNEGESIPINVKQIPFKLPFGVGSPDSKELISAIIECKNFDIFKTEFIQFVIQKKWEKISRYVFAYTFLLWSNILIICFVIATNFRVFSYCAFIINFGLLMWKGIQFCKEGRTYFKSFMNILDMIRFFITVFYLILQQFSIEYSWLTWIMMTLNLIKGITGFRAFNNTRYFIRLILLCILKTKDFFIIFIYVTFALGLMNSISTNEELTYKTVWSSPFGIIVGNTESFNEGNFIQSFTYISAITINMIIMLNMIISILGDVFDEFQLSAEIYNYTEMSEVIQETEQVISYWSASENSKYLHIYVNAYEKIGNDWKGKVIDIRECLNNFFSNNEFKLNEIQKQINGEVKAANESFSKEIKAVSKEIKGLKSEVKANAVKVENIEKNISIIHGNIEIILKNLSK